MSSIFQLEMKICFQVYQLSGSGCIRPFFFELAAKAFDCLSDVFTDNSLFLLILFTPFRRHGFSLHRHGSGKCYRVPFRFVAA